jgi:hypothetical protein
MNDQSFLLSKADAKKAGLAIGIGSLVMAITEIADPPVVAPTGRWSWLTAPIFEAFGPYGLCALWVVIGVFLIAVSLRPITE